MSTALGQAALRERLRLRVPPPAVRSYLVAGARRTEIHDSHVVEFFPQRYDPGESTVSHLRFALRHEPVDLRVLVAALEAIDPTEIVAWVRREPTGAFARRTWFFYETFTGRTLDLPDVTTGNYVDALDPDRHVVATRRRSPRHRVNDNLLGDAGLCPVVRRTRRLETSMAARLGDEARLLTARYDPAVLARAVAYLYTKETRSSFAIEGETPSPSRTERFVAALRSALDFDPADKAAIVRLQGVIVDPRYAAGDWRDSQNWVGGVAAGYREAVEFIPPRPEDVPDLMAAWMRLTRRLEADDLVDPVVAAAVSAFAFVFIHPFEDGNGRIHRFLIHHVLARRGMSPPGTIFPVSAAILRDRRSYDAALETFSKPLFECIDWHFTPERRLVVENDTADLYRYFDATPLAEYLYDRVADTVRRDLEAELDFVTVYDRALEAVKEIVDMPDRRASRFVQLCMGNGGRLAGTRRAEFPELTDDEIERLEAAVQAAMSASGR
ncbi:MAG TPA: Fic family protein [Thermodesulfobacteriota bacterium]